MVLSGQPSLLIVDDDLGILEGLSSVFTDKGYLVRCATSGAAAEKLLGEGPVDAVLLDVVLPDCNGIDLLRSMKRRQPSLVCGIITGNASLEAAIAALRAGADDFFTKPLVVEQIERFLQRSLDRKVLERELEISREQYRLVTEIAGDGIVVVEEEGRIVYWNPAAGRILGYDAAETYGRPLDEVLSMPGFFARMRSATDHDPADDGAGIRHATIEFSARRKDGTVVPVECSTAATVTHGRWQGVCIVRDISARKQVEEELRRSRAELVRHHRELQDAQARLVEQEKLAAIGQLAAGIAHEINNPMAFVFGNLQVLERYVRVLAEQVEAGWRGSAADPLSSDDRRLDFVLDDIEALLVETKEGAERIRNIVASLKKFARVEQEKRLVDLEEVLEGTLVMVNGLLRGKGKVLRQYEPLPPVCCVPSEIGQVFLNILLNAVDAIGEDGTITVATFREGEYACVRITDTGPGIDPAMQSRIFDPFFTTKAAGEGTGLGLSITQGIVRRHGGDIQLTSTPGQGTSFTVRLPLAGDAEC